MFLPSNFFRGFPTYSAGLIIKAGAGGPEGPVGVKDEVNSPVALC